MSSSSSNLFLGPEGLLRPHVAALAFSAVAGAGASAATVMLLTLINDALHRNGGVGLGLALGFAGLCLVSLVGRAAADLVSNRVGQQVVNRLRTALAMRILTAPIDQLERHRTHKLVPVLTQDVNMISGLVMTAPATGVAFAVLLGCLSWLAWLWWPLFLLLAFAMALGIGVQRVAQRRAMARYELARKGEDALQKAWEAIGNGAKELRLHRGRRNRFFNLDIVRTSEDIRRAHVHANDLFTLAYEFGSTLFFALIAIVLAGAAAWNAQPEVLSGFVLVLLYMKGPMDQAISVLPFFTRARVAVGRVSDMWDSFASPEPALAVNEDPALLPPVLRESIELSGVAYAFAAAEGATPFVLGPIDLRIEQGDIVFIVGENGSGKTTLIKLLLGLYAPHEGTIRCDGKPVQADGRDDYRQLFSTVFSDFHLFEALAVDTSERGELARACLARLDIAHKVDMRDGAFTTTDLSTGQRKRLALVHAWVEGRPVLVFDEWAADQDPSFRHLFYTVLLPELREQGRTLVVISHDDRYFGVADRVVRLREGRIVEAD